MKIRILETPFASLHSLEEAADLLRQGKSAALTGCADAAKPHLAAGLWEQSGPAGRMPAVPAEAAGEPGPDGPLRPAPALVVTYSDQRARELAADLQALTGQAVLYPARDLLFFSANVHGNALTVQRLGVVRTLLEGRAGLIVTTVDGLMDPLMAREELEREGLRLAVGEEAPLEEIRRTLVHLGYENTGRVEEAGQFSVRGGIVDIFPLTEETPVRVELWGDEIDSIRAFDAQSQRSVENLQEITVRPAAELIVSDEEMRRGLERVRKDAKAGADALKKQGKREEAARLLAAASELEEGLTEGWVSHVPEGYIGYFKEKTESFLSYFPAESRIILDEPQRILESAKLLSTEFREGMEGRLLAGQLLAGQADLMTGPDELFEQLSARRCVLLSGLDGRFEQIPAVRCALDAQGMPSYQNHVDELVRDLKKWQEKKYRVVLLSPSRTRAERLAGDLREYGLSVRYGATGEETVGPGELLVTQGTLASGFQYPLIRFIVLTEGDLFGGERRRSRRSRPKYEGTQIANFTELSVGDYVVHENHGLGIYQGMEKVTSQGVTKDYLKIAYANDAALFVPVTQMDLVQKYAGADARAPKLSRLGGTEWEKTKTRVKHAVRDIAADLVKLYAARQQSNGYAFGEDTVWQREFEELFPFEETEDQKRAIADTKADMESHKIMDRLICGDVGYGKTEIALRAAFKAVQESKQVVMLVPTTILAQQHYNTFVQRMKGYPVTVALLSRFQSASEQKKILEETEKGFVDVLTLSATPIPRTLHMSLAGIRDMSVLEEPPQDRVPIQTYVMEYSDEMVREAIRREMGRGGQVYYVYNRVKDIADVTARLQALLPEAVIVSAHGQMPERSLEKIMLDFMNREIDVLVSTTIIETGLDISNVNTIIIHDADRFGLSQLYQLRGRVGRSSRTAYAFLLYRRNKLLKEVAEKRLQAIREYTELGSGIRIAMRDLEIRGAGNVLGAEQHGHMEAVGYDLYCKLLNQAVKLQKNGARQEDEDFETSVDVAMDAFIPPSYIRSEALKLEVYKRIAAIRTPEEYDDIQDELTDRFGDIPQAVENLLQVSLLRARAHEAEIREITGGRAGLRFAMQPQARLQAEKIPDVIASFKGDLLFHPAPSPAFSLIGPRGGWTTTPQMLAAARAVADALAAVRLP